MTTIQTVGTTPAQLSHALMLYSTEKKIEHATLHLVTDGKIMPSTKPLTTHDLQALNDSLQNIKASVRGRSVIKIMPVKVLFRDTANAVTVWWRPGSPTPQFFNCDELGQIQGVTPMPALVFAQCGQSLSVCAVAGNERPDNDTPVFHAPMFNTYDDGHVCLGDIRLTPVSDVEDIDTNQSKFLRGINTHPNGSHRKTLYENGLFALWRDLIADPSMGWNDAWLNPMSDTTLGEWIAEQCK